MPNQRSQLEPSIDYLPTASASQIGTEPVHIEILLNLRMMIQFLPIRKFQTFSSFEVKVLFYQATYTNIPSGEKGNYNKDKIVKPSTKLKREREKKLM